MEITIIINIQNGTQFDGWILIGITTFAQLDFHEHWNLLGFVSAFLSLMLFFQNELMDFPITGVCNYMSKHIWKSDEF